jgi:MFS family permease
MLPFGTSGGYCVLSMLVITLGEMLWMPLASGWIAHRSDRGNRGLYMGWYAMTFSIAAIVAPACGGAVYQLDRNLVWYISIALAGIVLVGFVGLNLLLTKEIHPDCTPNKITRTPSSG